MIDFVETRIWLPSTARLTTDSSNAICKYRSAEILDVILPSVVTCSCRTASAEARRAVFDRMVVCLQPNSAILPWHSVHVDVSDFSLQDKNGAVFGPLVPILCMPSFFDPSSTLF